VGKKFIQERGRFYHKVTIEPRKSNVLENKKPIEKQFLPKNPINPELRKPQNLSKEEQPIQYQHKIYMLKLIK